MQQRRGYSSKSHTLDFGLLTCHGGWSTTNYQQQQQMSSLKLKIKGWEDGEPVERWLERPDRWQLHSADQVTLVIDDMEVTINQKVQQA